MASVAVSLPPIPTYHELHPAASPPAPSQPAKPSIASSSRTSLDDQSERPRDFISETTPHTSFHSDTKPGEKPSDDVSHGLLLHGVQGGARGGMTGSETAPGALDRTMNDPVGVTKTSTKLEDFELIRVLGKGCAGRVLLVRHTPTSSIRAMKALSKRSVLTHEELYHTLTELSILRRFAETEPENPFVSSLQCSFTDRENFYFVMDFYPGGDLATQMEIHGILGHHRTRFYAADLVQGLEDLHRHGIIVRDLKPENILLNARGHAVLADFGLSKEFDYRGEPMPLHVVTYPGEGEPPEWAGAGMGSARVMQDGSKRLVVDRASSFVGTSEYLSPEVVKRAEYTYAVDWWALGCIVLEGLIGRVPFRLHEDEPLIVLWNRIVSDPWDEVLKTPNIACRPLSDYGLDAVTWHFIDSLLIKDPMWRLTEPYVKRHGYFQHIDWETVQGGEYDDPHELDLHPVQEYNTRYFPKLCLEEEPSVDMRSHDARYSEETAAKTPLNDNDLYALECARFRKELAAFTWTRGDLVEESSEHPDAMDCNSAEESSSGEEEEVEADQEAQDATDVDEVDMPIPTIEEMDEDDVQPAVAVSHVLEDTAAETEDVERMSVDLAPATSPMDVQVAQVPSTSPQATLPPPQSARIAPEDALTPTQSPGTTPTAISPLSRNSTTLHRESPKQQPVPIRPIKNQLRLGLGAGRHSPSALLSRRLSQDVSPGLSPSSSRLSQELRLPSGAPQSGLSVSDIVSIPSPGLGSPKQIIRRHPQLESVDSGPIARLSVELHGTIAQLGDEDWEELDVDTGVESASNVPPSSFFSRVLKRRPSTLQSSSLTRQVKSSSSSSSSSPTKARGPSAVRGPGSERDNIGSKSFGTTKKALEKMKAFPKFRKTSGVKSGEASAVQSPSKSDYDRTPTKRDKTNLRQNGSPAPKGRSPLELKAMRTPSGVPLLALPPQISPLSESFSINMPRPEIEPSDPSLKADSGSDGELMSPVDSTSSDPVEKPSRPGGSRRHTESGTGWFDKKPRLRKPSETTWGKKMSASMSTGGKRSGLFRSASKSRVLSNGNGMGSGGSRSETALGQGGEVPKLELKSTPPLNIDWKEA